MLHLYLVLRKKKALLPPSYAAPIIVPLSLTCIWLSIQIIPGLGSIIGQEVAQTKSDTLSLDPSMTHIMLLKTIALTLYAWLLFCYIENKALLYQFVLSIVIAGFIQGFYASWLNLNVDMRSPIFDMAYAKRANGSFIYHNQLANFLALSLSMGIGVLVSQLSLSNGSRNIHQKTRDWLTMILSPKTIIRIGLIIMVIGLILTRSRMGNSAFFFSLAAISIFSFFFYNRRPKNLRLLLLSFFVFDLILIGSIFGVEKVKQRLVETSLHSETRDEVVRDSIPMIKDHPLIGTGGGSFYSSFPSYHPQAYSGFYDHAHNDYIQFSVELGLPITLMLGTMVLFCLFTSLQTVRKRKTALYQGTSFGCAVAISHMLLHSTVDFSLQSPAIALLFIAILSVSLISEKLPSPKKTQRRNAYT